MTNKKLGLLFVTVVLSLTLFTNCSNDRRVFHSDIVRKGELVVAVDTDMPAFFAAAGGNDGSHYEMLREYADQLGVTLRILTGLPREKCAQMLRSGEIDIVAGATSYKDSEAAEISVYQASYSLLARPGLPAKDDPSGKRILISSGFKSSEYYNSTMDSLASARKFITDTGGPELGRALYEKEYDYLICEDGDAELICDSYSNIRTLRDFDDRVSVSITLSTGVKGLREDLTEWLAQNKREEAADDDPHTVNLAKGSPGRKGRGISDYDDIIRSVARKQGLDWRLLSAIAYHESRFKSHVVSSKGAKGIMQIMPVVASHFGVPHDKIADPRINVMLAARLLKNIESSLQLPAATPYNDRMSIVLACYNAGVGHIADARRLARKYGSDANSWSDVSNFLTLKSQAEYYGDDVVRNGIFRSGKQTTAFVANVMRKYNTYCLIAQK